jgi:hypothetical protein
MIGLITDLTSGAMAGTAPPVEWVYQSYWTDALTYNSPDPGASLLWGTFNAPGAAFNNAICGGDTTCAFILGAGLALIPGVDTSPEEDLSPATVSSYVDTTTPSAAVANFTTNVTAADAASNLQANGFTAVSSSDGAATIFTNGNGDVYVLRPSNSAPGGYALDYTPSNGNPPLKINLGGPPYNP